jgi:hypothetical protein
MRIPNAEIHYYYYVPLAYFSSCFRTGGNILGNLLRVSFKTFETKNHHSIRLQKQQFLLAMTVFAKCSLQHKPFLTMGAFLHLRQNGKWF